MAHLKAKGELDNTLIIVTQDHGQTAKESLYDGGVRIALFARFVYRASLSLAAGFGSRYDGGV
jgi:arylsulfatase A-like enzyme